MRLLGSETRLPPKRRREVYEQVLEMSGPDLSYFVLTAVSVIIAAYGLLLGSTAVIIGAMLVAPLMGPVFGIALGLSIGDRRMVREAVRAELLGVLLAIAVATLIGLMPLRLGLGPEVMQRTQPTLYDLIVALVAGVAGAYALLDERVSPALPGVAISVAVVPPLAAAGLLFATERWALAGGALLLFVANLLAIHIAAAIVFGLFGMFRVEPNAGRPPDEVETAGQWVRRFGLSLLALLLVGWFMTGTLAGLVRDYRYRAQVEDVLRQRVRATAGAQLGDVSYQQRDHTTSVIAEVITPHAFEPAEVAALEDLLSDRIGSPLRLVVRSVLARDIDRSGLVFDTEEVKEEGPEVDPEAQSLSRLWAALSEALGTVPGCELADLHRSSAEGGEEWVAVVRSPVDLGPEVVAQLQADVREALNTPVALVVRSIRTVTATAEGYRYNHLGTGAADAMDDVTAPVSPPG